MNTVFQPGSHYAYPEDLPEAQTDHIARKTFDLSYASVSPAQKLDIYWPESGNGPFPVILSIHGGAFMWGDKRDRQASPMLEGLKRGCAVVSINYRMCGEALFPALVQDTKAAIRWVRANAERYLFDPEKIATWGMSAGAYLSLMAGVSAGIAELDDLALGNPEQSSHVQAVVAWFPPVDFLKMDEHLAESGLAPAPEFSHSGANAPESLILGQQITQIPDVVRAANPETYIRPGLPPFFLQHGTGDSTVPCQQSVNFAARLSAVLDEKQVTLELLPGAKHGDAAFETPQNLEKVWGLLDRSLKH